MIERITSGVGLGNFFKKRENARKVCCVCNVNFNFRTEMEEHKLKMHDNKAPKQHKNVFENAKQDNSSIFQCEECDFITKAKNTLNEHITDIHSSDFWLVGSKRRKRDNEQEN